MPGDMQCPECKTPIPAYAPEGACMKCLLEQGLHEDPEFLLEELLTKESPLHEKEGLSEAPGRYHGEREYASGGMGRILVAYDTHLGREVALKELAIEKRPGAAARFMHEARVTGQLEHPSIIPVYELGRRADGTHYYTMRLVRGKSLSEAVNTAATMQTRLKLLPHFLNLCQAIAYAHSRGIIHRDIKPGNVMIGEFGETVVIDWGLAKRLTEPDEFGEDAEHAAEIHSPHTHHGQIMGTPPYMSPEQASGAVDCVDKRSDVFSLGAVLYEILSGITPFEGTSTSVMMAPAGKRHLLPLRECAPGAPSELAAICERAMASDPEDRYQSAEEMAEEIQRFQSGGFVRAYSYGTADLLRRFVARNRQGVILGLAALLALIALAAGFNLRLIQRKQEAEYAREGAVLAWQHALAEKKKRRTGFLYRIDWPCRTPHRRQPFWPGQSISYVLSAGVEKLGVGKTAIPG